MKENIVYDDQSLQTIAKIANGSLRDSLSILEQAAIFSNNKITNTDLFKVLGLTSVEETITFLNCLNKNDLETCVKLIKDFYKNGVDLNVFCNLIVDLLIDKIIYLQVKSEQCLNKTTLNVLNKLEINDLSKLNQFLAIWQETFNQISQPNDKVNVLCCAILKCLEKQTAFTTSAVKKMKAVNQSKPVDSQPLFVLKERQISELNKPVVKQDDTQVSNNKKVTREDILFAAVANMDKKVMNKINDLINKIKNDEISEPQFSILQTVYKVFCASKNCVVLAFNDAFDAKTFNKKTNTRDFLLICYRYFNQPFYFAGFTVDGLESLKKDIQGKMHVLIPDLDLNNLKQTLENDKSIQQLAYNHVYKYLKRDKNENK